MKALIAIACTLLFPFSSSAQEVDSATVNKMLKDFQNKGILNKEQAAQAEKKLGKITPEQWAQIKKQAQQMKAQGKIPDTKVGNNVDSAAQMIDTNSPEFKATMEKMKAILDSDDE